MKHILFDLKQCLITSPLDDEEYVKETLIEASKIAKLEIVPIEARTSKIFLNEKNGKPFIKLEGKTKQKIHRRLKKKAKISLSLSDEKKYAVAFVTISL